MFKEIFVRKSVKTAIFLVAHTLIFVLFFSTLSYTLPFVLGFAISLLVKPVNKFLKRKLPFSKEVSSVISAILSTLLVFLSLLGILSFVFYKIFNEVKMFIVSLPDVETILIYVESWIGDLDKYYSLFDFSNLSFDLVQKFYSQIYSVISSTLNVTKYLMNKLISVVIGLPMILMIALVTFISTYFFSKDMPNIEGKILSVFTSSGRIKAKRLTRESKNMLVAYIKSYVYLMGLTFSETLFGLTVLGVDYALTLSIVTAIVDLLPVFGVGSVYFPMALYFYFKGKTFVSIGLIVMFVVINLVRQIAEPKLVSTNVGIHPLMIIASIFIGLKSFGMLGVLYFISTILLYKIFQKAEIL